MNKLLTSAIILIVALVTAVMGAVPGHADTSAPAGSPVIAPAPSTARPPGQYYLALGDSLTFGYQAARAEAEAKNTGTVDPANFNTGFVADFYRMLRAIDPSIQLVNLGCPGATSTDVLSTPGCPSYPFPLHYSYSGTQLQTALDFIKAHPGQVNPITVQIGPNDVNQAIAKCGGLGNLTCVAQALPNLLTTLGGNLGKIVGALRQADPTAQVIVVNSYNPYVVADKSTAVLATSYLKVFSGVATATGATLADVYTPFNVNGQQPQQLCVLTLFCTALHDIHASDAGYLVMAQAVWQASGFDSFANGFMVSWYSTAPGSGRVNFGPSCNGLVEVATRDLQPAGGVAHTVYVTGNDLPGTVGDTGIQKGKTYYYETVTVGSGTTTVDNNGGSCYTGVQAAG